mgnify:CR=1 FL=1
MKVIRGRGLAEGEGEGPALVSPAPISFYGGVDPESGIVRERGHPLEGACIAGKVLIFPRGKGSTVGSYVLLSLARRGKAPSAIINLESEPIIIIGCILSGIPLVDRPNRDVTKEIKNNVYVRVKVQGRNGIIEVLE